jgi:hypothetical protein
MFEHVYESAWFQPVFFWIGGAMFLLAIAARMPFLQGFLVLGAFEILADATLTGPWSPVPRVPALATAVPIAFVILGDARYFALVARALRGALDGRALAGAAGLAFVVPMLSWMPQLAWPAAFANSRHVFLLYEAMFVALAAAMRVGLARRASAASGGGSEELRWALRATDFELVQYALWTLADVVILVGVDAGFLLRLVPSAMYYVLFLPFVAWTAPRELAPSWTRARA